MGVDGDICNRVNISKKKSAIHYLLNCIKAVFNYKRYTLKAKIDGEEHIIKIGQTRKTFKDRLGSYNCGCVNNWRTASTTNLKLKQSLVATRQNIELYIFARNKKI
jgi:hypothetical protein